MEDVCYERRASLRPFEVYSTGYGQPRNYTRERRHDHDADRSRRSDVDPREVGPLAIEVGLLRIALLTRAAGLGRLTMGDVARVVDGQRLQSRTFDLMAAAASRVLEERRRGRDQDGVPMPTTEQPTTA